MQFGSISCQRRDISFFNDDVRVISEEWLDPIVNYLNFPGVGIVGPKLIYEDGLIQHAGMVTGVRRLVGTAFHCLHRDTNHHFNYAQSVREVSIICGALLAIKKTYLSKLVVLTQNFFL